MSMFFDTNVIAYAILDDDAVKQRAAAFLIAKAIDKGAFCISAQVLKELANTLTRKTDKSPQSIMSSIMRLAPYVSVCDTPQLVIRALELRSRFPLQFYDALIIAGAEACGCNVVLSEDMTDGARYGGVLVKNPFTSSLSFA